MAKKLRSTKSKSKSKSRSNAKLYLVLIVIAVLLGVVYTFRPRPTPIQIAEVTNAQGTVNLALIAEKSTLDPNESTLVTLRYDSPTEKLTAIEGEITFDPSVLTLSGAALSSDFPTQFVAPKIENGKLTFTAGVKVEAGAGLTGQGSVLTFQAKGKAVGQSTISVGSSTQVLTTVATSNTLREVTNVTLAVANPVVSSEPSADPSTDPSAEPSVKASASPSVSPSTQASADPSTPAAPNKPNAPTNLRYNCYSNGTRITLRWDDVSGATNYKITLDQKDGDNDQNTTSTRAEKDLDLKSNTTYSWKVAAVKNDVASDYTTVSDIKCNGDSTSSSSTPTPTPSPTATPTPTPTPKPNKVIQAIQNLVKPKSPSPTPTPVGSIAPREQNVQLASPISSPGSLADVFASPVADDVVTPKDEPSFLRKIVLGWQAIFIRVIEAITR